MKRVSFVQTCEYIHGCGDHTLPMNQCSCGRYICSSCLTQHMAKASQHKCQHPGHFLLLPRTAAAAAAAAAVACPDEFCNKRICSTCLTEHDFSIEQPMNPKDWCDCGKHICENCMELHLLSSVLH